MTVFCISLPSVQCRSGKTTVKKQVVSILYPNNLKIIITTIIIKNRKNIIKRDKKIMKLG